MSPIVCKLKTGIVGLPATGGIFARPFGCFPWGSASTLRTMAFSSSSSGVSVRISIQLINRINVLHHVAGRYVTCSIPEVDAQYIIGIKAVSKGVIEKRTFPARQIHCNRSELNPICAQYIREWAPECCFHHDPRLRSIPGSGGEGNCASIPAIACATS